MSGSPSWWLRLRVRRRVPNHQARLDTLRHTCLDAIRNALERHDVEHGTHHHASWTGLIVVDPTATWTRPDWSLGIHARTVCLYVHDTNAPLVLDLAYLAQAPIQQALMRSDADLSPSQRRLWARWVWASFPWREHKPRYSAHQHLRARAG